MRNLRKVFTIILSLPRTVWFNLRYLPFRQALRLPVWLAPNVRVKELYRGGIVIDSAGFNSTHIGFHNADAVDCYGSHTVISVEKGGIWHVSNDMHIGRGAIIHVKKGGRLSVGRNFGKTDTGSPEAQIALFSVRIAHLTQHLKSNHKDYTTARALKALVGKRRRLLDYLIKKDITRYRAIIAQKELGIRK